MNDLIPFIGDLAKEAGCLLASKFNQDHDVQYKGDIDLVTEADRMSEDLIVSRISSRFPDHGILTEESAEKHAGAKTRWIIDPLDGTTNYAHRFPVFCVSIALEEDGVVVLGAIYDPLRNDLFLACLGQGATLNGQPLRVSSVTNLSRGLLATGFPYDIRESEENNIAYFNAMAVKAQAIRRAGAAALDLAYLAAGRFDGFWELKLKPWDTAAGCLMVTEAGGRLTDVAGNPWQMNSPSLLASNGWLHDPMMDVLNATRAGNHPDTKSD